MRLSSEARAIIVRAAFSLLALAIFFALNELSASTVLRIYDYETGAVYVEVPAREGDTLYFGWTHSWEKIPWDEWYHIDGAGRLVLDEIAFPAFGAGIPEAKGKRTWTSDGMIHMGDIGQVFDEFTWINSHFATRDIRLNGELVTRGEDLPEHTRVNLAIVKKRPVDYRRLTGVTMSRG